MVCDVSTATGYDRRRHLRARDFDAWMVAARRYLPGPGGRVLDLGSGTGRFTVALAEATGATVVACEPSAAMPAVCRAARPGHPIVGGKAPATPFRAGAFDAIWASQVAHRVDDLAAFAGNVRRVLKPGGHLLLRGGFGPPGELPLYRYFPEAWAQGKEQISEVLAAAGLHQSPHVPAESPDEFIDRARSRSLSNLAGLADSVFQSGLRAMEQHAREGGMQDRIVERLDLVVFHN
jgi:SAM-dependent methyltransferase